MTTENRKRMKLKPNTISDLLASDDIKVLVNEIGGNIINTAVLIIVSVDRSHNIKAQFAGSNIGPFTVCGLLDYAKLQFLSVGEGDDQSSRQS